MAKDDEVNKIIEGSSTYYQELKKKRKGGGPAEEHNLGYESTSETLEPIYFWILDFMNSQFGGNVEKLIDNFVSSPGSGHFSELMGKATRMQEEAMKIMQTTGLMVKSLINIVYDLREFEIRLDHYRAAKSGDKEEAEAGLLALKQIWMDNVDVKRGRGSINMLAQDLNFVTIRDAFMVAKSAEDVERMDLNDRVKRILKPRVMEFFKWKETSDKELTKRYNIERAYLKNQVNSLKLYTRWSKPYLKAATELEMRGTGREPGLVKAFNTILLQLTLIGKKEIDFAQAVIDKDLPEDFRNTKLKRKYYSCVLVDFNFRGIPQKAGQHYVFGGKTEVAFRAYALNEDELKMLNQELEKSDINDALKLVEGMTTESLGELREEIENYLEEGKEETEGKVSQENRRLSGKETNPFSALFSFSKKPEKTEEGEEPKIGKIKKDNYVERTVRELAEQQAKEICFRVFDIYKKAHDMASHPSPYD